MFPCGLCNFKAQDTTELKYHLDNQHAATGNTYDNHKRVPKNGYRGRGRRGGYSQNTYGNRENREVIHSRGELSVSREVSRDRSPVRARSAEKSTRSFGTSTEGDNASPTYQLLATKEAAKNINITLNVKCCCNQQPHQLERATSPPHETVDEPSDEEVDTPADPNEDDLDLLGLNQL